MPRADIAGRVAVATLLSMGMSPRDILVEHYRTMWRTSRNAGSSTASEYRCAMEIVALVKPGFFMELAKAAEVSLGSIVEIFKDSMVVKLFQKVGWSMKGFWDTLKTGYKALISVQNAVAEYVSKTKVMKWSREELKKLDEWLAGHPQTKRVTGWVVGALLLYLWYEAADIGDINFDFDLSDALGAMAGGYALSEIFAGTDGSKLLLALIAGVALRLSFPWPGPTSVRFVVSLIKTLSDRVRARLRPAKMPVEQEAEALGLV